MMYIKNNTGHDIYDHKTEFTFIDGELLTEEEFSIFCPSLDKTYFPIVNLKKSSVFMFFGVRLERVDSGS